MPHLTFLLATPCPSEPTAFWLGVGWLLGVLTLAMGALSWLGYLKLRELVTAWPRSEPTPCVAEAEAETESAPAPALPLGPRPIADMRTTARPFVARPAPTSAAALHRNATASPETRPNLKF